MRKILLVLSIVALVSCDNKGKSGENEADTVDTGKVVHQDRNKDTSQLRQLLLNSDIKPIDSTRAMDAIGNLPNLKKMEMQSVRFNMNTLNALCTLYDLTDVTFHLGAYKSKDNPKYSGKDTKDMIVMIIKIKVGGDQLTSSYIYYDAGSLCPPLYNCEEAN